MRRAGKVATGATLSLSLAEADRLVAQGRTSQSFIKMLDQFRMSGAPRCGGEVVTIDSTEHIVYVTRTADRSGDVVMQEVPPAVVVLYRQAIDEASVQAAIQHVEDNIALQSVSVTATAGHINAARPLLEALGFTHTSHQIESDGAIWITYKKQIRRA